MIKPSQEKIFLLGSLDGLASLSLGFLGSGAGVPKKSSPVRFEYDKTKSRKEIPTCLHDFS